MIASLKELGANALPQELFVAIDQAASEISGHGMAVSLGSWVDTEALVACVFSRQTYGPACYNAPRVCLMIRRQSDGTFRPV